MLPERDDFNELLQDPSQMAAESGFKVTPGGVREAGFGDFIASGSHGLWWSNTNKGSGTAWNFQIGGGSGKSKAKLYYNAKGTGCSVRCIQLQ